MKAIAVVLSLLSLSVFAAPEAAKMEAPKMDPVLETKINQNLGKLGLNASEINESEVDGLIEVLTDRGLFYFSDNGQYLVHGKVYDLATGIDNLTEKSLAKVRISGVEEFKDSMIVFPAKDEKYKVTVFTDTSCGYCRKLHSQMQGYNDLGITVQYLAFPRSGITGPTFKELTSIWCAVDQQDAMTKAKSGDRTPAPQAKMCNMPVAEQYSLGSKVGVTGTPAMILEDGTMIPGYQDPAQLLTVLAQ